MITKTYSRNQCFQDVISSKTSSAVCIESQRMMRDKLFKLYIYFTLFKWQNPKWPKYQGRMVADPHVMG